MRRFIIVNLLLFAIIVGREKVEGGVKDTSFLYGIKISPQFGTLQEVKRTIKEVSEMGVKDAVIGIVWSLIETPSNDSFNWSRWDSVMAYAQTESINVYALVCYTPSWSNPQGYSYPPQNPQDYASFISVVLSRYTNQIKGVEIWNEPNLDYFWKGSVAQYVELLNCAYDTIKSVNPNIPVISGGLVPADTVWIDSFLSSTPKPKFDWFGYHPYARARSPAEDSTFPYAGIPNLKNVKSKLHSHGFTNMPIVITEFGYSTTRYAGGPVPSWEQVGKYIPEIFAVAQTMDYVEGVFYFNYWSAGYGLVDSNWNKRTGYYAYYTMMQILPYYTFETQISGEVDQPGVWILKFKGVSDQNDTLWFMFAPYLKDTVVEPQPTTIYVGSVSSATLTDFVGNQQTVFPDTNGNIEINVTGGPCYLEVESVGVEEKKHNEIKNLEIYGNKVYYTLPVESNISLFIYDISGCLVKLLDQGKKSKGTHVVSLPSLRNGAYFVSLSSSQSRLIKKFISLH